MTISLIGPGSDSLASAIDEAGIAYERLNPRLRPGEVINATGEILAIIGAIATIAHQLAPVLIAWIKAGESRKLTITTNDNKVILAEGFSVKDLERILPSVSKMAAIDIKKPKPTGAAPKT